MFGTLPFEQLTKAPLADEIDTVHACVVDRQDPFVGKRFHARWRHHLILSPVEEFAMSHRAPGKSL